MAVEETTQFHLSYRQPQLSTVPFSNKIYRRATHTSANHVAVTSDRGRASQGIVWASQKSYSTIKEPMIQDIPQVLARSTYYSQREYRLESNHHQTELRGQDSDARNCGAFNKPEAGKIPFNSLFDVLDDLLSFF